MQRTLRLIVALDVASEGLERRTAEWQIRTTLGSRAESRNHDAVKAKRRNSIADALLRIGSDGPNLHTQILKCSSAVLRDALEVIVDRREFVLCGHVTWPGTGSRTRLILRCDPKPAIECGRRTRCKNGLCLVTNSPAFGHLEEY